jgi:putative transposase
MTERRACRLANQPRGTQRYRAIRREDEDALTQAIVQLASQYGRYGYRRIMALLKRAGWRWARIVSSVSGVARGSTQHFVAS